MARQLSRPQRRVYSKQPRHLQPRHLPRGRPSCLGFSMTYQLDPFWSSLSPLSWVGLVTPAAKAPSTRPTQLSGLRLDQKGSSWYVIEKPRLLTGVTGEARREIWLPEI